MILGDGFVTDFSPEAFLKYAEVYALLYGNEEAERIEMLRRHAADARKREGYGDLVQKWEAELAEFRERWLGDWGHGTMIWVASDEPKTMFGEACFKVRKPAGTVDIIKDFLWWVPMAPIEPRYFKRVA
jgi:hypothetical protein